MALSVLLHGSRKLPVLGSAASKLLTSQFKSSKLVFTPIIANNYSGFNRQIIDVNKYNSQIGQRRLISHSAIWTAEKFLSVALLPIIPICLTLENPIADQFMTLCLVLHMHWGIESVVVDYIRPSLVGPTIPKIARAIVYVVTVCTLGGLMYFNYNDIGISKAAKRLWKIGKNQDEQ